MTVPASPRVSCDDDGFLDEFFATNVRSVHFEAMDDSQFWIGVEMADGTLWHIDCGAINPRAKGYAHAEQR